MDCKEILQPIFDHARRTAIDKKAIPLGGGKHQENEVFATEPFTTLAIAALLVARQSALH